MRYIGIDLSARRGFDVAVLDEGRRVVDLWRVGTLERMSAGLDVYGADVVAAVDAPQAPSSFPLRRPEVRARLPLPPPEGRFMRHRVCDYELVRRSIGLYLLPAPGDPLPDWMALGIATFARLRERHGLRLPHDAADYRATLLEVYPYAGFVTLLGARPPRKTTRAGAGARIEALRVVGLRDVPAPPLSHDAVDALCAAYTAWAWRHGQGCALGRADEGLIVLPVAEAALFDRYRSASAESPLCPAIIAPISATSER